ncbi:unnamed protein product, partial [Rhizoctonia solani]
RCESRPLSHGKNRLTTTHHPLWSALDILVSLHVSNRLPDALPSLRLPTRPAESAASTMDMLPVDGSQRLLCNAPRKPSPARLPHHLRLATYVDPSARALHFEPVTQDVRAGGAILRISCFTDKVGAAAMQPNSTKVRSKVASRAHTDICAIGDHEDGPKVRLTRTHPTSLVLSSSDCALSRSFWDSARANKKERGVLNEGESSHKPDITKAKQFFDQPQSQPTPTTTTIKTNTKADSSEAGSTPISSFTRAHRSRTETKMKGYVNITGYK